MVRRIALVGSCLVALQAGVARAHVCMDAPVSRVGEGCNFASPQKVGPCGVRDRGTNVTTFRPGQTISVALNETIDHPSHYRIAFNADGDDFADPTSVDDTDGAHSFVLRDGIVDEPGAKQTIEVTLPDVTCDGCTLQLIQVMYDKGGNGFGGNDGVAPDNDDIYYACADLVLAEQADEDASKAAPLPRDAGVDAGGRDAGRDAGRPDGGRQNDVADAGTHAAHDEDAEGEETSAARGDASAGCHVAHAQARGWGALAVLSGLGAVLRRRRRRAR
jgi:hypothetical protein